MPDSARGHQKRVYYRVLSTEHARFAEALGELFRQLDALELPAAVGGGWSDEDAADALDLDAAQVLLGKADAGTGDAASLREAAGRVRNTVRARRLLRDFITAWPLPLDAWNDLTHSYRALWRRTPTAVLEADAFAVPPRPITPIPLSPLPAFLPYFDEGAPGFERRLDAVLRQVKDAALASVEALERPRHGHRTRVTRRYTEAATLARLARRFFRRAVLEWPWAQIAQTERDEGPERPSAKTVKASVQAWGTSLGIPVPVRLPTQGT